MKYIKLTENHKSGTFAKGDVIQVPKESLEAWKEAGIVKEVDKEEFDTYTKKQHPVKKTKEEIQIKNSKLKSEKVEKLSKEEIQIKK